MRHVADQSPHELPIESQPPRSRRADRPKWLSRPAPGRSRRPPVAATDVLAPAGPTTAPAARKHPQRQHRRLDGDRMDVEHTGTGTPQRCRRGPDGRPGGGRQANGQDGPLISVCVSSVQPCRARRAGHGAATRAGRTPPTTGRCRSPAPTQAEALRRSSRNHPRPEEAATGTVPATACPAAEESWRSGGRRRYPTVGGSRGRTC
jgi:hypothetical protein